ncbi:MAG: glycosyltransferase family 4 protein [Methylohalobius sp.]|nr:glycosyltransferase family 4 protein [Methylohalobius sp.]
MRVAILAPIAWRVPPRHYGGWEQSVSTLTESLVREGVDVTLFASRDSITSARLAGIIPHPVQEDPELRQRSRGYEILHVLHCLERAGEFDLIHSHAGSFAVSYAPFVAVPFVVTLHGSGAEPDSQVLYRRFSYLPYVAISQAERRLLPELNYAATIHHGIEVEQFPFSDRVGQYLLFVGRLAKVKGVHHAIALARHTNLPLVLAGIVPKEEETYFEREILPHIDDDQIRYVGPVDAAQRNALCLEALAFLHLVEYEEAFGLTMIEAMACGLPVIGFARGAVPEVIAHQRTGFVVQTLEEAVEAVGKIPLLSRAACRMWVSERFHARRMAQAHVELYQKLLNLR